MAADSLRAFILAETDTDQARKAYDDMAKEYQTGWAATRTMDVLVFLGSKNDAVAAMRKKHPVIDVPDPKNADAWGVRKAGLAYRCERLSADEYLNFGTRSNWARCDANFSIGLTHLANGERDDARTRFHEAVDTRNLGGLSYDFSRCFLERMKDPNWPGWIKK